MWLGLSELLVMQNTLIFCTALSDFIVFWEGASCSFSLLDSALPVPSVLQGGVDLTEESLVVRAGNG